MEVSTNPTSVNFDKYIALAKLSIHTLIKEEDMFFIPGDQNIYRFNTFEWTGSERLDDDESWRFLSTGPIDQAASGVIHSFRYHSQHGEGMPLGRLGVYITPLNFMNPSMNWAVLDSLPHGVYITQKLRPCWAITGFVIRREYHRCICPSALGIIMGKLPALEHMSHETWCLDTIARFEGS